MKLTGRVLFIFSLLFLGTVPESEGEDNNLITGVTFIDRSQGRDARLYEVTGVISKDENTRYVLGMEYRDDLISQRFARFGVIHATPVLKGNVLSMEADYWPGIDGDSENWHIYFLSGELKMKPGALLGLSYKYFDKPGDDLGLASLKAGYYNRAMMITGEVYDSLDPSPVRVNSAVLKGVFYVDRISFLLGGSAGKTFISYAQLEDQTYNTSEIFAGITYRWRDEIGFTFLLGRSFQEDMHQYYYTVGINKKF